MLIALGAEQVVESWNWNNEVVEFRNALDSDLSYDLGTYRYRLIQGRCVKNRLDQLEQWLDRSRRGSDSPLSGPISLPMRLAPRVSAWEARTGEVYNHIPLKTRLAYGEAFDNLTNFEDHTLEERAIWRDIGNFDGLQSLTRDEQVRLGGLIRRERFLDYTFELNWPIFQHIARRLGVHAIRDPEDPAPLKEFCRPIG